MVYLSAKYQEISLGSLFHSLLDDIEHIEAESLANTIVKDSETLGSA